MTVNSALFGIGLWQKSFQYHENISGGYFRERRSTNILIFVENIYKWAKHELATKKQNKKKKNKKQNKQTVSRKIVYGGETH